MSRVDGTVFRLVRCKSCGSESKGDPAPTVVPGLVIAYCPACRRRGPAEDLGPTVVEARPTRLPEIPAELVDDASGMETYDPEDEEDQDRIQKAYRDWRGTPDGLAVVAAIRRRALELRRRGWRRYGIQALAEVARYDRALSAGPDAEGFKVNNSHLSRLARDLMEEEPELRSFFETRELRRGGTSE